MDLKNNIFFLMACAAMLLSGCAKDSFQPGEESHNTKGLVWFSGDYQKIYYFYDQPQQGDSIYVFVERADSTDELTLVIQHEADACLTINDTVHFAGGEAKTYLPIDASKIRLSEPAQFTLRIPDEYANNYTIKGGTCSFSSSILWSSWTPVSDTLFVYSYYEKHPKQGCQLENFLGANVFRVTNFLGSGNPLMFSLSNKVDADNLRKSSGMLIPLQNCYYPTDAVSEKIWDWSNDGQWTPFTPKGGNVEISYLQFGWGHYYYESYGGYDSFDFSIKDTSYINYAGETYMYDSLYINKNVQMVYVYSTTPEDGYWDYLDFMICYKADNK